MATEYFHFKSVHSGDRYFQVDWLNSKVTQIVLDAGTKKKGRPHMVGIMRIAESSFRGTYHWHYGRKKTENQCKMLATTQNQYNQAKERVLQLL
jgi:hypothetical protein